MKQVADSQDLIPWKDFMEGKLSTEIFALQKSTLVCSPSRLTIADWLRQLIAQILHISNVQCMFCNISLHDKQKGYLQLWKRNEVLWDVGKFA